MASDRSPPQKSLQSQHIARLSSSSPSAVRQMPTPGLASRTGSAESPTPQGAATGNDLQSQPYSIAATASPASEVTLTATEPPSASTTPAPYGTRSRGRNAAPRPNYAEDRDIDMDLEIAQPAPKSTKRTSGVAGHPVNGSKVEAEKVASSSSSRKSLTATNGATPAATPNHLIPGTSSFSAKPDETNGGGNSSRKRKQPASSTSTPTANGSAAKKLFTAAPGASHHQPDTNMVSFEERGAYLEDGKLTADDGTTFAING